MLYTATYPSKLGDLILLSDEDNLLGLWFKDQKFFGAKYRLEDAEHLESRPIRLALDWLAAYFAGKNPDASVVPLRPEVTAFRTQVLHELQQVPYGETTTYKALSDQLQKTSEIKINKSRAIGNAVGHNPISLIIPCHRVVGSDGSLTGYAGGIERKKALLAMEQSNLHTA